MNEFSVFVSAKTMTVVDCVKLTPAVNYTDSIVQGQDYINVTQTAISVINMCSVPFTISGKTLFSDTTNGGNFVASVGGFTILPQQTINVPVVYNGMYLGSNLNPNYTISINGVSSNYALVVTVPQQNNPPVVTDIGINLQNRQLYTFTLLDFVNHFADVDGDTLDAVMADGTTTGLMLGGVPYVSGTWVTVSEINNGDFKYQAPDTDAYTDFSVIWKAKDSAGQISI